MPWTRLDDAICDDDKVLSVSPSARWLYIAFITSSRRNQTAGELTRFQMAALLRHQGLKPRYAEELVVSGLLIDIDYGYAVPHYEKFNPLTSTERVRKHRSTKQGGPGSETPVKQEETKRNASPAGATAQAPHTPRAGFGLVARPVPIPITPQLSPHAEQGDPALPLVLRVEEVMGHALSLIDREKVSLWPTRYEHITSARMVEIVQATHDKFSQGSKILHSPVYCEGKLREENAEAVDLAATAGVKPPRYGLDHIGTLLAVQR